MMTLIISLTPQDDTSNLTKLSFALNGFYSFINSFTIICIVVRKIILMCLQVSIITFELSVYDSSELIHQIRQLVAALPKRIIFIIKIALFILTFSKVLQIELVKNDRLFHVNHVKKHAGIVCNHHFRRYH